MVWENEKQDKKKGKEIVKREKDKKQNNAIKDSKDDKGKRGEERSDDNDCIIA